MREIFRPLAVLVVLVVHCAYLIACSRGVETSVGATRQHAPYLVGIAATDTEELRRGLPEGAALLAGFYRAKTAPRDDLSGVRTELDRARNKVIDLRVAKSTFFALVELDGTVLRTDREPDVMSGKNLFAAFPALRSAMDGKLSVCHGNMTEASGVRGRTDGQLAMAVPVQLDGRIVGVYASGWSWSAYAYRLENALRSDIRSKLKNDNEKVPLVYVYIVVGKSVFGAPVSPEINAEAIRKQSTLEKTSGESVFSTAVEITGRDFGLSVQRAPTLGDDVAIAVLRSET